MTTTNLLLIAGVLLFVGCYVYVYFGAKRLARMRNARVEAEGQRTSSGTGATDPAPPVAPVPPGAAAVDTAAAPDGPLFLAAPDGQPDDLMRIKGIGPKLAARLAELGVFHYRQIADWTPAQMADVDSRLGNFQGRPERDQWQSQARLLAAGDVKAYERMHGKLGAADPPASA